MKTGPKYVRELFLFSFGVDPEGFPETVLITPYIPEKILLSGCEVLKRSNGRFYSCTEATKNGKRFAAITTGVGAGPAGDAVLLLGLTDVKTLVFAGSCGGFGMTRPGDIIIPEKAVEGEGFSRYHSGTEEVSRILKEGKTTIPDAGLVDRVYDHIRGNSSRSVEKGGLFTVGSLMAEDPEDLSLLDENGFLGIEMELSAVYGAAAKTGIKAAAVLVVSDLPGERPFWGDLTRKDTVDYRSGLEEMSVLVTDIITERRQEGI